MNSSQYINPESLPPGPVLVVGLGNSGAEIAHEVAATTLIPGDDYVHEPLEEVPLLVGRRNRGR